MAMARLALALMAVGAYIVLANNEFSIPYELRDKLWLVALFPAVYLLCVGLLRE
ncbi:MAG: hypothetical protein AB7L90_19960 [Hyphomicrobiaceae bacterium]